MHRPTPANLKADARYAQARRSEGQHRRSELIRVHSNAAATNLNSLKNPSGKSQIADCWRWIDRSGTIELRNEIYASSVPTTSI